ncbi:hypothetical protein H1S01_15830 [Heliobacterium chlorum]|uniref:Copper amine oxidase-like N-terminal domain-containing protein n=1 Tax=Heliobacterium chlorum TaxID=2698 RepID=A0ABR7T6F7_HELCL|nr:stalk domain-containing protein [Heliobacterium chlorum]MBC9785955.1 hypothetical protein [Heliobacterium chlorum]
MGLLNQRFIQISFLIIAIAISITLLPNSVMANEENEFISSVFLRDCYSTQPLPADNVLSLYPGELKKLDFIVVDNNGLETNVDYRSFWMSDNFSIVSVGQEESTAGVITGIFEGNTVINAIYKGHTAKINVHVRPIKDVELSFRESMMVALGDPYPIFKKDGAYLIPFNSHIYPYEIGILTNGARETLFAAEYAFSDEQIARLGRRGTILPISEGSTVLTLHCGGFSKDFEIRIVPNEEAIAQQISVNGQKLDINQKPSWYIDQTYLPIRGILNAMGANIQWDGRTQSITVIDKDSTYQFSIDSYMAWKNGKEISLSHPPKNLDGQTMVPLSFIQELLSANVSWDENDPVIQISTNN